MIDADDWLHENPDAASKENIEEDQMGRIWSWVYMLGRAKRCLMRILLWLCYGHACCRHDTTGMDISSSAICPKQPKVRRSCKKKLDQAFEDNDGKCQITTQLRSPTWIRALMKLPLRIHRCHLVTTRRAVVLYTIPEARRYTSKERWLSPIFLSGIHYDECTTPSKAVQPRELLQRKQTEPHALHPPFGGDQGLALGWGSQCWRWSWRCASCSTYLLPSDKITRRSWW